jgi:hypothetical protein
VWLWLSGQDESLQVLGTGALLYLMACGATGLATSLVGTAVMHVTKIFSAWLVAPFMVRQKMRYCLISAGLLVLTYGILWRNGVPPLCATFDRGSGASDDLAHMVTSGNLWYWLSICWKTPIPPWLPEGVVAVLLFVVLLAVWRASRAPALEAVALGTAGCTVVFSCFYKMTFGAYAAAAILPLSWLVRARFSGWGRVGYVIWCVILAVDSSVWYHIRAHPMGRAATAGWLLLQTGLVGLHLAILAQCALLLWRASTGERYGRGKGTSQSFREV